MHPLQNEHLNVVLVDDDPVFREIIGAKIAQHANITIFHAGSGDELFDVLPKQQIDCIILDYDLGIDSGLSIKQRIDESRGQHPPTLMLTGDGRESTVIRAFRMGIHDYLPKKGLRPEDVVKSVLRVVERDRKEAVEKAEHARLVAASAIDMLTGLEGRVRIDERLARLASLPPAARSAYGLILIELAEFNKIAETVGLKAADQALRDFGQTLQRTLRSGDICGRYSGSNFVLIADVAGDSRLLDQICHRLSYNLTHELRLGAARIDVMANVNGMVCSHAGRAEWDSKPPVLVEIAKAAGFFVSPETEISPEGAPRVAPASRGTSDPVAESRPAVSDAYPRPAADTLRVVDRRREPRQRVFKKGSLHVIGARGTFDCMVRNISSRGAGLRLESIFPVPETCELEIAGSGTRQRVAVRWQTGADLGVEYLDKQ